MPTSKLANTNNFIRWNKVSGSYPVADLPITKLPPPEEESFLFGTNIAESSISSDTVSVLGTTKVSLFFRSGGGTFFYCADGTLYEYTTVSPYTLAGSTQTDTFTLPNTIEGSVFFNPTGTKFYVSFINGDIYEFTMSSAWNISTASQTSLQSPSFSGLNHGLWLKNDGTALYVVDDFAASPNFEEWALSTPYDLSTIGVSPANSFSLAIQGPNLQNFAFSPSGNDAYFINTGLPDSRLFQYSLSTAFDLTTMSYTGNFYDLNDINSKGIFFQDTGNYFVIGNNQNTVKKYQIVEGTSLIPEPYGNEKQFDELDNPIVTLFPTEKFQWYANLDELETDGNFANWQLDLVFADSFNTAASNIAPLEQDFIQGYNYRFYINEFTVPSTYSFGCYRLVIQDGTNVLYISNKIKYSKTIAPHSFKVQYRNNLNILNFNYEGLPAYKNQFRIDLVVTQSNGDVRKVGYELVSSSFNAVRTLNGNTEQFITEKYIDLDHDAFEGATVHKEISVFINGEFVTYTRGEGQEYLREWENNYPLSDGSIRLERSASYSTNRNV